MAQFSLPRISSVYILAKQSWNLETQKLSYSRLNHFVPRMGLIMSYLSQHQQLDLGLE